MKKVLTIGALTLAVALGADGMAVPLDTVYQFYAGRDNAAAWSALERLQADARSSGDRVVIGIEVGDYFLDKQESFARAESVYSALLADNPKMREVPDVLYRLALAQELQEKYLDAARNYEKVATRYSNSRYGTDALDAIERCFRKNYQDRVAYVDGYPITRIELDDRISRNPAAFEPYEKKEALLDSMIDTRLMYGAALAAGAAADPAFVSGMTDARSRALFQRWYEVTVTAGAEPTERELNAVYRRDLAKVYTTPEKVHGYQIQVATKAEADSLRRLLTDTTVVWDSVARQASQAPDKDRGGDMGLFARGVQPRPIEDAAFRLKPGQMSQPVKTAEGYVLLKVTEKKAKSVRAFADVKNQIAGELRQANTQKTYDAQVAALKSRAVITSDSTAIEQNRDTLAVVNGAVIDQATLAARIEQVPAFFRAQFDSPEGKRRILDQLVLERLLLKEVERRKLWLDNKVVDQLLTRRATLATDTYRRMMTTDQVTLDSAALMANYKLNIKDFREPTKVHVREIAATTESRAVQLRRWAVAGRIPAMIQGRAIMVPDPSRGAEALDAFATAANADSVAGLGKVTAAPVQARSTPTLQAGPHALVDLSRKSTLAGPFSNDSLLGFGFPELSRDDRLYQPEVRHARTIEELESLLGMPADSAAARAESSKLGTYVRLEKSLPADFVPALFKLDENGTKQVNLDEATLAVKVTKKDTAQTIAFADLAKKFSKAPTRWAGGDLYWLAGDDKVHDARLVEAAFGLSKNGISPVLKLNDSTYTFLLMEERKDAYTRPFSEVRAKIETAMRRDQEKQLYDDIVQRLRTGAKIEVLMKPADFIIEPPAPEPEQNPTPTPSGGDK